MNRTPRLVTMVNDIAAYFASEPDRDAAVQSIALHLRRFWAPRLRHAIAAHLAEGGVGLGELARDGVRALVVMESMPADDAR